LLLAFREDTLASGVASNCVILKDSASTGRARSHCAITYRGVPEYQKHRSRRANLRKRAETLTTEINATNYVNAFARTKPSEAEIRVLANGDNDSANNTDDVDASAHNSPNDWMRPTATTSRTPTSGSHGSPGSTALSTPVRFSPSLTDFSADNSSTADESAVAMATVDWPTPLRASLSSVREESEPDSEPENDVNTQPAVTNTSSRRPDPAVTLGGTPGVDASTSNTTVFQVPVFDISSVPQSPMESTSPITTTESEGEPPQPLQRTIRLHRPASGGGYGIRFGGAENEHEAATRGRGVFVMGVVSGSVASSHEEIESGMQVHAAAAATLFYVCSPIIC